MRRVLVRATPVACNYIVSFAVHIARMCSVLPRAVAFFVFIENLSNVENASDVSRNDRTDCGRQLQVEIDYLCRVDVLVFRKFCMRRMILKRLSSLAVSYQVVERRIWTVELSRGHWLRAYELPSHWTSHGNHWVITGLHLWSWAYELTSSWKYGNRLSQDTIGDRGSVNCVAVEYLMETVGLGNHILIPKMPREKLLQSCHQTVFRLTLVSLVSRETVIFK